jgi:hypothetical protein
MCRAIDHAQAAALRLAAVPVSVLNFVSKELGVRAALRMCVRSRGHVGCDLCAHERGGDITPLAGAQCGISRITKTHGRAVRVAGCLGRASGRSGSRRAHARPALGAGVYFCYCHCILHITA